MIRFNLAFALITVYRRVLGILWPDRYFVVYNQGFKGN